jgi:hypothetical protein
MSTVQTRKLRENPPLRRPTETEIQQAREALHRLETAIARTGVDNPATARLTIHDGVESELEIPPLALTLLDQILYELAQGNGVELEPVGPLLTLAQAAARLGVPEAFVTKLIEDGELTCRIERNRQTVVFEDLMAYRKKDDEETSKALDEMVAIAQELGLGY